tara:strand:+ start:2382 stop:2855 length:474 start_codon:yes stop_codon:yes gene_type:complete
MLIYALYCSENTDKVYIGSTKMKYLSMRKAQHRYSYNKYLKKEHPYLTSCDIVKDCYKHEHLQIELLEEISDNTREGELWWIRLLRDQGIDVVNNNDPVFQKDKHLANLREKYKKDKESGKVPSSLKYYHDNKVAILAKRKAYYDSVVKKVSKNASP